MPSPSTVEPHVPRYNLGKSASSTGTFEVGLAESTRPGHKGHSITDNSPSFTVPVYQAPHPAKNIKVSRTNRSDNPHKKPSASLEQSIPSSNSVSGDHLRPPSRPGSSHTRVPSPLSRVFDPAQSLEHPEGSIKPHNGEIISRLRGVISSPSLKSLAKFNNDAHRSPPPLPSSSSLPTPRPAHSLGKVRALPQSNNSRVSRDPAKNWLSTPPAGVSGIPLFSRRAQNAVMPLSASEFEERRRRKPSAAAVAVAALPTPTKSHMILAGTSSTRTLAPPVRPRARPATASGEMSPSFTTPPSSSSAPSFVSKASSRPSTGDTASITSSSRYEVYDDSMIGVALGDADDEYHTEDHFAKDEHHRPPVPFPSHSSTSGAKMNHQDSGLRGVSLTSVNTLTNTPNKDNTSPRAPSRAYSSPTLSIVAANMPHARSLQNSGALSTVRTNNQSLWSADSLVDPSCEAQLHGDRPRKGGWKFFKWNKSSSQK